MQNNTLITLLVLAIIAISTVFAYLLYRNRISPKPVYGFLGKRLTVATVMIFAILAIGTSTYFLQTSNLDDRSLADKNDAVTIDFVKNDTTIELTGKYSNFTTTEYVFEWSINASNTGLVTRKETKLSVSKISIANANTPIQITLQIKDVNSGAVLGTKNLEIK